MAQYKDSYYLQKVDCNCNDCAFMKRDLEKYKIAEQYRRIQQLKEFERKKQFYLSIPELRDKGEKMVFQYDRGIINYGLCTKFDKDVTFIPMTCQLETQHCFAHRLDGSNLPPK